MVARKFLGLPFGFLGYNGGFVADWKKQAVVGFEAQSIALIASENRMGSVRQGKRLIRPSVTFRAALVAIRIVCPGFSIEMALTAQMPAEKNNKKSNRRGR